MHRDEIPPGTLYLLILRTLARSGEMHGYEIANSIQRISDHVLQVEEGSLYPALQRMLIKGWVTGEGSGPLDAQKAMNEAKQLALRKARKEMLQAIRAEDDRNRSNAIIPVDVTELATGKSDELVQVP